MHVIRDDDGTVLVTRIGRDWIFVPRATWDTFTAAVRRGDFDASPP